MEPGTEYGLSKFLFVAATCCRKALQASASPSSDLSPPPQLPNLGCGRIALPDVCHCTCKTEEEVKTPQRKVDEPACSPREALDNAHPLP